MKVVISEAKRQEYKKLFQDFQSLYGSQLSNLTVYDNENPDDLRLPLFYQAVGQLVENDVKPLNKFFRLPLEEPYFEVDMDSRTITVPAEFTNYGIGVSGDANAEMVFFQVPRYYDNVDLYAIVQKTGVNGCWVQWHNNTTKQNGNSKVIFTDAAEAELLSDKNNPASEKIKTEVMYLGWLITEDMTESAGNLEFSLRFFETVNNKITYSISTQKASCPIKSTLNLSVLEAQAEDMSDVVYNRPLYSDVINSMDGASAVITQNLDGSQSQNLLTSGSIYNQYQDDTYGNRYANGVYVFHVTASSPDGGTIVYQWYKGGEVINGETSASYAANIAGAYNVRIGNQKSGVGTRWTVSPTVIIPAARAIKFGPTHNWAAGIYSRAAANEDATVIANEKTLKVAVVDKETGGAANGTLRYVWKRSDLPTAATPNPAYSVISGAEAASYCPPLDAEGRYTCTITNYLNNTTSEEISTSSPAIVRAEPDSPELVQISYNSSTKLITITNVEYPSGSKSQEHQDEWKYQWINSITGRISEANGGKLNQYSVANLAPNADNAEDYVITLEVQHVVWEDNTPGPRKASRATTSNPIRLHVSGTGTGKTITEITGA